MKKGQEYRASTTPPLPLILDPKPKRVGVYVDCEVGQVSFYNAELGSTKSEVQKMIQDRQSKMEEIKRSVELSKKSTEKEVEYSDKLFTALLQSIKKRRTKLVKVIKERQKAAEGRAEGLVKELEQEITELQRRSTELEQFSHTEDHLHLLQSLPSLRTPPSTKKWSRVSVNTDLCVGTLRRALSQIEENIRGELKVLTEIELTRMQEFKDEVTLDPNTANRWLQLSEGGTRIKYAKTAQTVSDNPKRFDYYSAVLGEKGFNSGRHYWEVQLGVSGRWEVGVAMRAVNRKKAVQKNSQHGFFVLSKSGYLEYEARSSPSTTLNLSPIPRKVGVYVDYEKGQVSFYDVLAKSHLYSFLGLSFTRKLYPYFYLYSMKNKSESLVIYIDWIKKYNDHLRTLSNTAK